MKTRKPIVFLLHSKTFCFREARVSCVAKRGTICFPEERGEGGALGSAFAWYVVRPNHSHPG